MEASKLSSISSADRIDLILVVASKLTWFLCERWNMTRFLCGGSKLTVSGRISWFKCATRLTFLLCRWRWSKLARFLDAGRKSLGFSVNTEIGLFFVGVVDSDLIQRGGTNLTWFKFWDRDWFGLIWFKCWDRDLFGLCLGVKNEMVLVYWSKIT